MLSKPPGKQQIPLFFSPGSTPGMILTEEGYLTLSGTPPAYFYYLKDHQGNNRVVLSQAGTVEQVNHYYPFGGLFGEGAQTSGQPYRYNGKELDSKFGLDFYDYGARHYDAALGRWFTVDPLAEKYYSVSPYAYVADNPIRYIDPTGCEVDLSQMSEEERKRYELQVTAQRKNSKLFNTMYTSLEKSKDVYLVKFGQTTSGGADPVKGQFAANKEGGGTVTFLASEENIQSVVMSEEFFHAYQHDNRDSYGNGEFNVEFEAKVFNTAVAAEAGMPYSSYQDDPTTVFKDKIYLGDYSNGLQIITPSNVVSESFLKDYNKSAIDFAKYNIKNNIGNSHYKKNTTVAPYSLQKVIYDTYK